MGQDVSNRDYVSPYLTLPLRTRAQADNGKQHIELVTGPVLGAVWVEYAPKTHDLWPSWMTDLAIQLVAIEAFQ